MTRQYLKRRLVTISQVIKLYLFLSISGLTLDQAQEENVIPRGGVVKDVMAYHSKVCLERQD